MKQTILNVNQIHTVDSYPYGRKRTTAFFSVEFVKGKGFRHVFQTINPANGRENKPKKGTYRTFAFNTLNPENEHIECHCMNVYGYEEVNKICAFIAKNYDTLQLTPDMIEDIFISLTASLKANMKYSGIPAAEIIPVMDASVKMCIEGIKTKSNLFGQVVVPVEKLKELGKDRKSIFEIVPEQPIDILTGEPA